MPDITKIRDVTVDAPYDIADALHSIIDTYQHDGNTIDCFGFRVVHGGQRFYTPTVVTDDVIAYLEATKNLAPLHNPPVIMAMELIRQKFHNIPVVAVFDTGFHRTMPELARRYAISDSIADEFHIQRYGFHGLAYASMLETYCDHKHIPKSDATIIAVQLGSGCSMCAIQNGRSVDTTMGFSPMEGLISRTRSGDIDASIVSYLSSVADLSQGEVSHLLNFDSGLKGMGGHEGHMGRLLKASQEGDVRARRACDLFVYRIQKYLGAFDAVLGGTQAFVFGGGISEHCPEIIQKIFATNFFRTQMHEIWDTSVALPIREVSSSESSRGIYVISIDEEKEIAREVLSTLTK